MITGPQLPATVTLPRVPTMTAAAVRSALNASKQMISYYRRRIFPAADHRGPRSVMRTADVAAFVTAYESKVLWS
jgi:hypothetical protein